MRHLKSLIIIATCVGLTALAVPLHAEATAVSAVPKFNVAPSCRGAAQENLSLVDKPTLQSCLAQETVARDKLAKTWSTYPAGDRSQCAAEAQVGGFPSYVELLGCLQEAQASRKLNKTEMIR